VNNKLKKGLRILLVIISGSCLILAYLVYPAKPGKSSLLKFESFIVLPQGSALNILDYLIVSNDALFVAGLSQGSVFKIAWDADGTRLGATVSELQGSPEVHGVALLPSKNLAFITRSGKNTVDVVDSRNLQLLQSIPVADDPDAILYDQPSNLIYVANGDAGLATLIDPDKKATVASILLPGRPEFPAVDSPTGVLYQNLVDTDTIAAIDLTSRDPLWVNGRSHRATSQLGWPSIPRIAACSRFAPATPSSWYLIWKSIKSLPPWKSAGGPTA